MERWSRQRVINRETYFPRKSKMHEAFQASLGAACITAPTRLIFGFGSSKCQKTVFFEWSNSVFVVSFFCHSNSRSTHCLAVHGQCRRPT